MIRSDIDARQEMLKIRLNEQGEHVALFSIKPARFDMKARHPFREEAARAAQQAAPQQGEDLFHFHGVSILSAKSGEDIPLLFSIITGRVGRRNGEKGVEGRILGELFDGLVRLSQGIHRIFVPFAEEKILPTPQKHAII